MCIIDKVRQEKQDTLHQILSGKRRARIEIEKKGVSEKCRDEEIEDHDEDDEQEQEARGTEEDDSSTTQPRAKRQQRMRCNKKACSAKGCQKTHFFGQRNGKFAQSVIKTSALLMHICYNIINVNFPSMIFPSLHLIHKRKTQKTENFKNSIFSELCNNWLLTELL